MPIPGRPGAPSCLSAPVNLSLALTGKVQGSVQVAVSLEIYSNGLDIVSNRSSYSYQQYRSLGNSSGIADCAGSASCALRNDRKLKKTRHPSNWIFLPARFALAWFSQALPS